MNRKTFLATIAALFTAPFVKSKEKTTANDIAEHYGVPSRTLREYPRLATRKEIPLSEFKAKYTVPDGGIHLIHKKD